MIRAVTKWTEKILQKAGPIKPKALLLAFTGVAASLIGMNFSNKFNLN